MLEVRAKRTKDPNHWWNRAWSSGGSLSSSFGCAINIFLNFWLTAIFTEEAGIRKSDTPSSYPLTLKLSGMKRWAEAAVLERAEESACVRRGHWELLVCHLILAFSLMWWSGYCWACFIVRNLGLGEWIVLLNTQPSTDERQQRLLTCCVLPFFLLGRGGRGNTRRAHTVLLAVHLG